jgi:flagellar assembly factor FliW
MKFEVVLPVLGFENIKEFELEKINDNFYTLKNDNIAFTLINPFLVRKDYDFEISEKEQKILELDENSSFLVLNIMIVNKPFLESTVNFAAPLIFNLDKNKMGQIILEKYGYGLTEPLKNFVKSAE